MGWERPKRREKIFFVRNRFYPTQVGEFQKKAKKFKKFNNIILASFQAEVGRDSPKKSEKKFLIWNRFYSTRTREFLIK